MKRREILSEAATELAAFFVGAVLPLAAVAGLAYVVYHFIAKGW